MKRRCAESNSTCHKLLDDGWPRGIVLSETVVMSHANLLKVISEGMIRMFEVGQCVAAICMYDGAFGSYDDLLAADLAPQTYAFSFSCDEAVVNLDSEVLASAEWRLVISQSRRRLE